MDDHAISIIIPTYNRGRLLARAIRSALAAVDDGDEVIVVDDGSTDDTPQQIRPFRQRIEYVRVPQGGAGRARNIGVARARNPLVAFLDSDDEWIPDKLQLQRQVMRRWPYLVFCYSDFGSRLQNGREIPFCLRRWVHETRPWDEVLGKGQWFSSVADLPGWRDDFRVHLCSIYPLMLRACHTSTCAILIRRSVAGDTLHFPEDQPCYEDWECFARLSGVAPVAFLDCATFWQYDHTGPRLTDLYLYKRASCVLTMLTRVWGQNEAFLTEHRAEYDRAIEVQRLILARRALVENRVEDARAELSNCGNSAQAVTYRLLAALPGPVSQGLRSVKRAVGG